MAETNLFDQLERRYLKEPKLVSQYRCAECGEECVFGANFGGRFLCEFCLEEMIKDKEEELALPFAESEEHFAEFLRWWFELLPQAEQERILRPAYQEQREWECQFGGRKIQAAALEFCRESEEFSDDIRSRMMKEEEI